MTTYVFNGVSYDDADLTGASGRGYAEIVTTGTGVQVPRYIAPMIDALSDVGKTLNTTSGTSMAIGTGAKSPVMASEIPFAVGAHVLIARTSAPNTTWMFGQVTARSGTTLTVSVSVVAGSGTHTDWTISLSGPRGAAGAAGGGLANVSDDTSPTLGGDLDGAGNDVSDVLLKSSTIVDFNDVWTYRLGSVRDGTYDWSLAHPFAETLVELYGECSAGSFSVDLKVNGTTVATVAPSAGSATDNTFSGNISANDDITIVVSSASGVANGFLRLKTKRSVAVG